MLKILLGSVAVVVLVSMGVLLTSCERATVSVAEGYGARPVLPAANPGLIPTVNIAPAVEWADGETPIAADDFSVNEFAGGFDHPRWLHVLPNGDVLVAESNAPAKPDTKFSLKGWVMGLIMGACRCGRAQRGPDLPCPRCRR